MRILLCVFENQYAERRNDLSEQLQPLARHCRFFADEAGDVPARPGQARNEAGADRR
jgi:hypothetical protein